MADIPAYHRRLRAETARLAGEHPEGCLYIVSIATPGDSNSVSGSCAEVPVAIAARHFIDGSAREATPAEIQAYIARGESLRARANAQTQRERRPTVHFIAEDRR